MIPEAVRALRLVHQGSETGFVTVSCGAAVFADLVDLNNPLELVQRANETLYKARATGETRR